MSETSTNIESLPILSRIVDKKSNITYQIGNYFTEYQDTLKEIEEYTKVMGYDEIPVFNETTDYLQNSLVLYNNVCYRFTKYHSAGVWNGSQVVETDLYTELISGLAKKADKSSLGTAAYTNKNDYAKSGELVSEHEYDKRFTIFCDNNDGCYNNESGTPAIYWGTAIGENIGRIGDEAERTRICFYNQDDSEIQLFLPEISDEYQVSYFYANTQHFLLHTDTDLTIALMSAAGIIPVRTIDSANTPVLYLAPGETLEIKAHLVGGSRVTPGLTGRDAGSIFITEGINDEHIEYYNATPYYFVTYTIYPAV